MFTFSAFMRAYNVFNVGLVYSGLRKKTFYSRIGCIVNKCKIFIEYKSYENIGFCIDTKFCVSTSVEYKPMNGINITSCRRIVL